VNVDAAGITEGQVLKWNGVDKYIPDSRVNDLHDWILLTNGGNIEAGKKYIIKSLFQTYTLED
jgi:hypothetical protein